MKRKPRRKGAANEENSDNDSCCSSPVKEKENLSPDKNGRQSMDTHQHQFITLLKDFDQNGNTSNAAVNGHCQIENKAKSDL